MAATKTRWEESRNHLIHKEEQKGRIFAQDQIVGFRVRYTVGTLTFETPIMFECEAEDLASQLRGRPQVTVEVRPVRGWEF